MVRSNMEPIVGLDSWSECIDKMMVVHNEKSEKELIENLLSGGSPRVLSFLNAHAANLAWKSSEFSSSLISSDILLRDGSGIGILMKALKQEPGINMNGTDFIPQLLAAAPKGWKIALLGTEEPYLSRASCRLRELGFKSIYTLDGFQKDEVYLQFVRNHAFDLIILAMGMPKQERVAQLIKKKVENNSALIINGGAIVDFMASRHERSPLFIRRMGFEWLYRLYKEPRRLWRRYIIGNSIFLIRVLHYWLSGKVDR